ncbi:alpha/beta hydrolase [Ralstonia solanacearum species complex bacterium KE056]|uniref:alpha/beta hydrolase n=1 Tax=Ralstonia solanacearum species complex bacterium KE056 TaxID=3119585 RepID=UPI002FC2BF19
MTTTLKNRAFTILVPMAAALFFQNSFAWGDAVDPQLFAFAKSMRSTYASNNLLAGKPDPVEKIRSVSIKASNPDHVIVAHIYVPKGMANRKDMPIVLFVHGGGFISGDLTTHDVMVRAIANGAKALVIYVDYRLAPEHPFPAGLEDVYTALKWTADHAGEIGGNVNRIAVAGDSAGGNLAAAVSLLARDRSGPKILAQWLMYPTLSNKMDTGSWKEFGDQNFPTRQVSTSVIASYVPKGTDPNSPLVAPLYADHNNLPPALIQVGGVDPLRDEAIAYSDSLQQAGVEANTIVYKGQTHGFIQYYKNKADNSEGEGAIKYGIEFLHKKFSSQ